MINSSTSDIAGIEFGDHYIAAVRLRGKWPDTLVVTHAGWTDCDPSSSPKVIADAVRDLWRESRMPTRTVCASLRSASLALRGFSLPSMSEAELKRVLLLKAEEALQMPQTELIADWQLYPEGASGSGSLITGLLAAAPAKDVERELEILCEAGLDPVVLDIRSLAVANLYSLMNGDEKGKPVCLVNVSPHSADVMIRKVSGEVYPHSVYCRSSTWAKAPGFLEDNMRDVLKYSEYKLGWDPVDRVVLTGRIPVDSDFIPAMREALGCSVDVWNPLSRVRLAKGLFPDTVKFPVPAPGILVPALGLALRRS